jgi:hypothetical protein
MIFAVVREKKKDTKASIDDIIKKFLFKSKDLLTSKYDLKNLRDC